jgi:hypothetical protein
VNVRVYYFVFASPPFQCNISYQAPDSPKKDKHHKQNTAFEQNPQKSQATNKEQEEQERAAVRRPRTLNGASTKQKVIQKGGVSSIIPHLYSWREAGMLLVSDGEVVDRHRCGKGPGCY